MSKALVIKGVDFSENKLTTVTLLDDKSCVSIELDKTTLSLANLGTESTLVATVLPADTTDLISWSSSNSRVASVDSDGVVTVCGAGTATITATCGTKTATCIVTTTHTLAITKSLQKQIIKRGTDVDSTNSFIQAQAASDSSYYACGYQTNPLTKHIYQTSALFESVVYPVYFGHANKLTITAPNNIKVTVVITDSTKTSAINDMDQNAAKWLLADASPWDSAVSEGNREISNIPEDADSIGFSFRKSTNDLTLADLENITVVAS